MPAVVFSLLFLALIMKFRSVMLSMSEEISKNVEDIKYVEDVENIINLVKKLLRRDKANL